MSKIIKPAENVELYEYRNGIYGYDWKLRRTYASSTEGLNDWNNANHGHCAVQLVIDGKAVKYADARYF